MMGERWEEEHRRPGRRAWRRERSASLEETLEHGGAGSLLDALGVERAVCAYLGWLSQQHGALAR